MRYFLRIGLADSKTCLDSLLTLEAPLLDCLKVACILVTWVNSRSIVGWIVVVTVGVGVDMLARLCKGTLQFLQFLLLADSLCLGRIETVKFVLGISVFQIFILRHFLT